MENVLFGKVLHNFQNDKKDFHTFPNFLYEGSLVSVRGK